MGPCGWREPLEKGGPSDDGRGPPPRHRRGVPLPLRRRAAALFRAPGARGEFRRLSAPTLPPGKRRGPRDWTMRNGAKIIFQLPRLGAIRILAMSHMIHRRGQLSVYLRLNEVALPSIYGPSADESA